MEYLIIAIPLAVGILTQCIKILVDICKGHFSFSSLHGYGGIPSGHAAFITSAVTTIYLLEGMHSSVFLLSLIVAIIVFRDAVTLRKNMGEHGKVINQLIKELPDSKEYAYPVFPERLGHTVFQVLVGIVTGFILTIVIFTLIQQ